MSTHAQRERTHDEGHVRWLHDLSNDDVDLVGGKNASLGEMISSLESAGIAVPDGFATVADAYWSFIDHNDLREMIEEELSDYGGDASELARAGKSIRKLILDAEMPPALADAIREAYATLSEGDKDDDLPVAVRSSATAEDLPTASFAGQQETYLNVRGAEAVIEACQRCFASLFTDRAISYREENDFDHMAVALSVGVQRMVRASDACSGVMFTIDTETGFPDVVYIDAAFGLGETVVGGEVAPDGYLVFKPLLDDEDVVPILSRRRGEKMIKAVYAEGGEETIERVETPEDDRRRFTLNDDEVLTLARWAAAIERHYERPMDIEWAKDGETGDLFILQARPETVQSQRGGILATYTLRERSDELARGLAIGDAIATGTARVVSDPSEGEDIGENDVLVAPVTDPDWEPIMERASAIVTDHGGRTAHAAIISRELGIPAIVGTGNATEALSDGQEITVSCAEGSEGIVYEGQLEFDSEQIDLDDVPAVNTTVMMNIASPAGAFRWHALPCRGIGLARMEFIIMNTIEAHPMALVHFDDLDDEEAKERIDELTSGYDDKSEYFVDRLSQGIARIAASHYPDPVVVRTSDFKTNEYAKLVGGRCWEPSEENPMLGLRGASRYAHENYREGFALECKALRRVRETIGLDNVVVMIPFCRTLEEADRVLDVMREEGLERGREGLKVYVMAEIPSNVLLAREFSERFDGFSIGTNDLTQLVLGIDRDSAELAELFDERNDAVKKMIRMLIEQAHEADRPVGLCGQAPSDHPEFAEFLVEAGIDSISLNPDSVVEVIRHVSEVEARREQD